MAPRGFCLITDGHARALLSQLRRLSIPSSRVRETTAAVGRLLIREAVEREMLFPKEPPVFVPILRAGLGLFSGASIELPEFGLGLLGLSQGSAHRDPSTYIDRLPSSIEGRQVVVMEPVVASGRTLIQALDSISSRTPSTILVLGIISTDVALERIVSNYPDLPSIFLAVDHVLEDTYTPVPGIGDMGDRLFGQCEWPPPSRTDSLWNTDRSGTYCHTQR